MVVLPPIRSSGGGLVLLNGLAEPTRRWRPYWFILAAIFLFLSLDEAVEIHGRVFDQMLALYHLDGFLRFTWIIPYGVACFLIGALYVPFVLALPDGIRSQVIFGGALYISAAIGAESVGAHCATVGNACAIRWKSSSRRVAR